MNAGTKYLMDSIAGLVMEVANLRSMVETKDAQITQMQQEKAAAEARKDQPAPADAPSPTATFDEHGRATP